jgi:hypothetical protein
LQVVVAALLVQKKKISNGEKISFQRPMFVFVKTKQRSADQLILTPPACTAPVGEEEK